MTKKPSLMRTINAADLLANARKFPLHHTSSVHPHKFKDTKLGELRTPLPQTPSQKIAEKMMLPGDIITPEELASRLKVPEGWIFEKTRSRCDNPIPCLHMGRFIRFDWPSVVGWLESEVVRTGNRDKKVAQNVAHNGNGAKDAKRSNHTSRK